MKHPTHISLLLLAATMAGAAHAQQSASATFVSAPAASAPGASAEFGAPKTASDRCERTVSVSCEPKRARKVTASLKSAPSPKVDRLAVHPEAAIKDTAAPEINLPGVMKVAGADAHALDFSRARVVDVTDGGSQTVYVSHVDQNRIQLPWPNTKVIGTEELTIDKNSSSNNVYVQFKEGVQRAVTVWFEQPGSSKALGLQLVPKQIPAQTIRVRDTSLLAGEPKPVKGNDYVAVTQGLMEQVALGGTPQGYSAVDIAVGPIAMNGLVVTPQKQYSSADKDIYVYDVANPGPQKASLQEKEFDGDNVLAVSIFPKPVLAANEHTRVIVLTRKASGG
jgi:conjugal transfer pilus assembly protein TraK